ncbi:hypothetical protein QRO11_16820 [Paracidovorax citrulli]|uniref:Uncharacterized protein n=1 Tax=Paracidovorax citrulli TaxID=80869 RepID=A0ABY9ALV0_PARCI|nr:hypothetical protein [Paracidovorax citrulli]PVY66165.1 hypothetical protein C8E08_3555 [Paracidovorax citrulli]QCX11907.1 hypothetical protein APS58_3121 [Paracidovorax citrulli]REG69662.1 hypothetical protein C8E07_2830 [Paracidovorax citrulli]RLJ94216.1 hypothetical protein C8E06_2829 [Paracidovorax citrulli]UEG45134.1 hypothetical protein LKW27_15965 [Paracidovorax citrulli]
MLLVKTPAGQLALKDRHGGLTPRQRSAFILFDGRRTVGQVLAATAAMGITMDDVQAMIDQGLLESPDGRPLVRPQAAPAAGGERSAAEPGEVPVPAPAAMAMADRYQGAYRVATELTSGAGLRGFRLNLAVEGARNVEELAALAPKIRELVGEEKYRRLQDALFG